jgi:hypothetical protein
MVGLIRTDRKAAGSLYAADEMLKSFRVHEFDRFASREPNRLRSEVRRRHDFRGGSTLIDHDTIKLTHYLHSDGFAFPSLALHDNNLPILAEQQVDSAICAAAEHLRYFVPLAAICFRKHVFEMFPRQIAERIDAGLCVE